MFGGDGGGCCHRRSKSIHKNTNVIERSIFEDVKDINNYDVSSPSFTINSNRKGNIINIGNDIFMISSVGYCFDKNSLKGKTKMCVSEIKPNFKLNSKTIDTCYVYTNEFYDLESVDSISIKSYLDIKNLMIVKTETFNKNGKVIAIKELQ